MIDNIKIGVIDYKVSYPEVIYEDERFKQLGRIKYDDETIEILKELKGLPQRVSFLHEVIHGIFNNAGQQEAQNEGLIEALSYGFMQVIRDNPEFIKYLMKK